jgi:predicted ATP-grasp superfamily ATP-dependent carboligase
LLLRERLDHRPILFLRADSQVRTVSEYRGALERAFQIRLPEHGCLCELLHKGSFQRMADKYGFPIPRAVTISEERDLAHLDQIEFPAVIKPCDPEYLQRRQAPRAQVVYSREQAEAVCRATLSMAPEIIVQQWV